MVDELENSENEQRETVYDGELHKCPSCGERLDSFVTVCPACGYELRNVKTNSPVESLVKKIEQASSLDEKNELIANFYIPNTKEDICDFFILALSNLEDESYDTDDAWSAKLEQAYHKAKLSFGDTPEFEYLSQLYSKAKKQRKSHSFTRTIKKSKGLKCLLLGAVGIVLMLVGELTSLSMISIVGYFPIMIAAIAGMNLILSGKGKRKADE